MAPGLRGAGVRRGQAEARRSQHTRRMTTVTDYQQISRNLDKSIGRIATRADVKRESEYYLSHITKVTSADELMKDDRLFNFAMTAFGLKDMIYGKAFMKKVLKEGIDGTKAFAVQLSDPRFREFAETFNFARYGKAATAFTRAQQGTVDKFLRITLEDEAGKTDEGVRLALYFKRKAPGITSVYGLMGDAALYKVVQAALGLPSAASNLDVDKQAAFIKSKIDIDKIKDGTGIDAFLSKFTARWQMANGTPATSVPHVGLAQDPITTIDTSSLMALQALRSRH